MLRIVGIGPGDTEQMTDQAKEAVQSAKYIVGYKTYIPLIQDLLTDQEVISTGMRHEVDRCQTAIDLAKEDKDVAVVSSGDAGIYGMAGLIFELMEKQGLHLDVQVVPGITAGIAGAALLGAPLMNDFCLISLSDLMTPKEMIEKRLHAAAEGDFVICLYNPRSKGRPHHLKHALEIIRKYKGGEIPVGIVKDVGREGQKSIVTTIDEVNEEDVDMTTTVIVGNKYTKVYDGYMYTPRGYNL